jgi:hypothetical protein
MAYNEKLANRIRKVLAKHQGVSVKKMFGGIAFLSHLCRPNKSYSDF